MFRYTGLTLGVENLGLLALSCTELLWLALTLVEIKFARKSKQVFHHLATQPKSMPVEWRPLTYYYPMKYRISKSALKWVFCATWVYLRENLRIRLATQRKSLHKFNLRPLAATCRSVWPGLYGWVCLISPLCYRWNCLLLKEFNHTVISLLRVLRNKATGDSKPNDSPAMW